MNLTEIPLKEFLDKLADDSPAPGGGSVAALAGALSAALCAMVASLTLGRKKYKETWREMASTLARAQELIGRLSILVDRDTAAYERVMAAYKLPREGKEQQDVRRAAIQDATLEAAEVPMETLRTVAGLLDLVEIALKRGNPNCITDAGVAALLIRSAAEGASYNVRINLAGISDESCSDEIEKELDGLLSQIKRTVDGFKELVEETLK